MKSPYVKRVRTYCAQCFSNCPVEALIENGRFTKVIPDKAHRFFRPLCPKGHAGPEMVHDRMRLEYPVRRTHPKGADDPGWERISWSEALDIVADQMRCIKAAYGAEAFAFSQTNVSSPLWELTAFIRRLANLYGSPNHMTTTHICNWHRDNGSALTYAKPGESFSAGWPDFERSKCILMWGHNPKSTFNAYYRQIHRARKNGSKIIVVDPRRTDIAAKADIWLQIKPGTDGVLALGMIHVLLTHEYYDQAFVKEWTNAPFLVRSDTGDLLRLKDRDSAGSGNNHFYVLDDATKEPVVYKPGEKMNCSPDLEGQADIQLSNGKMINCKTVFTLLKESVALYTPVLVALHTSIAAHDVVQAVQMIVENSPACWFSFNGVEQNLNATQTNRAICVFYSLTGDYDKPGGNVVNAPIPPLDYPYGFEFVTPEMFAKNLALKQHPLGPAGTLLSVPPYLLCKSIESADPYKVRGLLVFGANTISASPHSKMIAEALKKLDFHVHVDHFLNPTAKLADIVLPSASFWETGRIGYALVHQDNKWVLQWREPVSEPRGESKDELWIIFELARRLGYQDSFWDGDIEAAFEAMLRPVGVTLQELKASNGGIFMQGPVSYQKYKQDGFNSMSGRVELFSQHLKDIGESPLPEWKDPFAIFRAAGINKGRYPLLLINAKLREYCHSQHRSLPSLRRKQPHPLLEMNKLTAAERGIVEGDWVVLETIHGRITLKATLTDGIARDVVCTQHGWWQACLSLGLEGHDIYSADGANVNLLYKNDFVDSISGSVHIRGFPCNVVKKDHLCT